MDGNRAFGLAIYIVVYAAGLIIGASNGISVWVYSPLAALAGVIASVLAYAWLLRG